MRILYLIPRLEPSGASRQLEIVARGLHAKGHEVVACQLGPPSTTSAQLEGAGLIVQSLGWTRPIDPLPLWRLHQTLHGWRPEVIHVFHRTVLRTLALVGRKFLGKVVLSRPFDWQQRPGMSAMDRWLLRRVARIVVQGEAEANFARELGLFLEKIVVIPPGVAVQEIDGAGPGPLSSEPAELGADWDAWPRKVMCVGPLERHKGFRNAVWVLDLLRFVFDDLHLVFVGDGPDQPFLEQMAQNVGCAAVTHFLKPRPSLAACHARADFCWAPSLRGGGTQAVLEAMAAGRAVIACPVPSLDGLLVDGESGFYVAPDDKVNMARRSRDLLRDPGLAQRIGSQARQRVLEHFPAELFVERCQRTYVEAAA